MAEQGCVDRAVVRPGWDISSAGPMYRVVAGLEMCPLASLGQGLMAPGLECCSAPWQGEHQGQGGAYVCKQGFPGVKT